MSNSTPDTFWRSDKISREDFTPGKMKCASYSGSALSAALIDHLSRIHTEPSKQQLRGIDRFNKNPTWNIAYPENNADLSKWFHIIDDIFFNGLLQGIVTYQWVPRGFRRERILGMCAADPDGTDPRYRFPKMKIDVTVYYETERRSSFPRSEFTQYVNVLIHEMIHGFFFYYVRPESLRGEYGRDEFNYDLWGGHDPNFIAAARAVEDFKFPGWNRHWPFGERMGLYMYLGESISTALQTGANLPNEAECRRLGIDVCDLLYLVRQRRRSKCWKYLEDLSVKQIKRKNLCSMDGWLTDADRGGGFVG